MTTPTDHCPACRVARELTEHRDTTAVEWSIRRGALSFALVLAQRACPAYVPASSNPQPDPLDQTLTPDPEDA